MGKEILTGLVEEDAKRGFEKARDYVRDENGGGLSITGLLEAVGLALKGELEYLQRCYGEGKSEWPALRLVVSLEPRQDDPKSAKYYEARSGSTPAMIAEHEAEREASAA